MVQFECPSCKQLLQVAEENAGKTIVCPECKASTTIPSSAGAITAAPALSSAAAPTAVTTPENVRPARTGEGGPRRDRDTTHPVAAAGMNLGMVLLIVFGVGFCAVIPAVGVLIALLVPAVQKVREAEARSKTMNNMKQIGVAWHNHESVFREFPGPKMRAQNVPAFGVPLPTVDLSWRVALLPFLEQEPLFKQFDKTVAWDHANNRALANTPVLVYDSVWRANPDPTQTQFQYFTGPNTMFTDPPQRLRLADIPDGTSNTFMFAEALTRVPWPKPADIALVPNGPINVPPDRFLAAMADGSVRFIDRRGASDAILRLLIDPRDGMVVPQGVID